MEAGSIWAGEDLPLEMHIEEVKDMEKKWRLENMIPAWMDYPDEISSEEEDCEEEEEEEEEEEDGEEGGEDEEYSEEEWRKALEEDWRKECEEELMKASKDYQRVNIRELKMRKKMCIAWIVARMDLVPMTREFKLDSEIIKGFRVRDCFDEIENVLQDFPKLKIQEEREMMWEFDRIETLVLAPEARERREMMRRQWQVVSADENVRTGWKVNEMERFTKIRMMMWAKKAEEAELAHAMRLRLNEFQLDMVLKDANPSYLAFRNRWMEIHSCWGGVFEHITQIRPMCYTSSSVPQYVYNHALPDTLHVLSVKVEGITGTWPLDIFGLVAIRDSVDQYRNMIFNRTEFDCQTITQKNPYLVLTGPTRAVVMNEESVPVTIEAELKVKSTDGSEDKHLIFAAAPLPSSFYSGVLCLVCGIMKLKIELVRVETSVEATIFTRVVTNGTWPDGYNGQLTAQTSNIQEKIVLAEFQGDGPVTVNGGYVDQNRFVVPVEAYKELVVSCNAWRGVETMQGQLTFMSEKKGRSRGTLVVGPCIFEVLVVWSPIQPVCEELVGMSQMDFVE